MHIAGGQKLPSFKFQGKNMHPAAVSREDWIDSGMIRKSNVIGKLTLKVPEAEVMYKFNLITLHFYTTVCPYTGHRGN